MFNLNLIGKYFFVVAFKTGSRYTFGELKEFTMSGI